MRFSAQIPLAILILAASTCRPAWAETILYQSDFNSLDLGQTAPYPGAPGQGGWFSELAVGDAYGEIEDGIAVSGRALHEHTATTVPPGLQTIDRRLTGPVSLNPFNALRLSLDFYASTSDLSAVNIFEGALYANGGPSPDFFVIIGLDLVAGNGAPKGDTGVNVALKYFNGVDNNGPIPLSVGQGLSWDAWHHVELSLDQAADRWNSITVDGQTQSLTAYQPPRSLIGGTSWIRGTEIGWLDAVVIPDNLGGVQTDDDVYWDNVRLSAAPEPASLTLCLLGAMSLGSVSRWRRRKARSKISEN